MGQEHHLPRPSLFITCRLAQVVQKVKHRLQQRLQIKRKGANPYGASYQRGLRLRAFSDLQRVSVPRRCHDEPTLPVDNTNHENWVNSLLHDLDDNTHLKVYSLTKIAANDNLLLSHSKDTLVETFLQNVTVPHAAYLFDLSTLLLNRIEAIRSKGANHSDIGLEYEPECKRLQDELFLANLTHLLRRLQYMLLQTLVRRSLQALDECANHWNNHWLQRKQADDGWFAEWPDSQPPFSSTMPWNIKPSLVVLWGVCWMFYPHTPGSGMDQENVPSHPVLGSADFWQWDMRDMSDPAFPVGTSQPAAAATHYAQADETSLALNQFGHPGQTELLASANQELANFPQPQGIAQPAPNTPGIYPSFGRQPQLGLPPSTFPATAGPYPAPYNNEGTAVSATPFLSRDPQWLDTSGGNFPYASSLPQQPESIPTSNVWPQSHPEAFYPIQTSSVPNFTISPVSAPPSTQHLFNTFGTDINPNRNRSLPIELSQAYDFSSIMGGAELESVSYPSPPSVKAEDVNLDRHTSVTSQSSGAPRMPNVPAARDTNFTTSPSSEGSRPAPLSVKREEPPRNAEGLLECQHPDCRQERQVFRRSCEWNKHMDKHERPYKCPDPACDKIPGFTYSGGLLRHQREVHKNVTTKKLLFCPVTNCNRHIEHGHGFTRKENLNEHMRRRHAPGGTSNFDVTSVDYYEPTTPDARQALQFTQQESPIPSNKKRKRAQADEEEEGQTPELPSGSRRGSVFAIPPVRKSSSGENIEHIDMNEKFIRMEHESRKKDERIRQLEEMVRQLRARLQMGARQQGLGMT